MVWPNMGGLSAGQVVAVREYWKLWLSFVAQPVDTGGTESAEVRETRWATEALERQMTALSLHRLALARGRYWREVAKGETMKSAQGGG